MTCPAACERVLRRHDEQQLLAHHRHAHEVRIVDRKGQQAEIGRPRTQLTDETRRRARCELHIDVRMQLAERLQQRRKHVEADGHAADQPQASCHALLALDDGGAGLFEVVEQPLAEAEERRSGRRDPDLASEPQEQLLLQLLFEQEDLPADGRLGEMELLAGAGERSGVGDGAQDLELPKVHAVD